MTETLVEALARAMFEADPSNRSHLAWERSVDPTKRRFRARVAAVLSELDRRGYAVVPKEPTQEMLASVRWDDEDATEGWAAMLTASPKAE